MSCRPFPAGRGRSRAGEGGLRHRAARVPTEIPYFAALSRQQDLAVSPLSGALDSPDEVWPYTTHTNLTLKSLHSKRADMSQPTLDPVCGMTVDPAKCPANLGRQGSRYFSCSQGCAAKPSAEPDKYLKVQPPAASPPPPSAVVPYIEYICAMHPEVHKSGPGSCPKCGMALEPASMAAPLTAVQYTCRCVPRSFRAEPESCPICGMA